MATRATSAFYSAGFADPIYVDSSQHSRATDAYGIGISLLMALAGVESRGLKSAFEDDVMDMAEGADGAGKRLLSAARQAAAWPEAATRELVKVVHGLCYERKSRRLPLPEALAALERALRHGDGEAAAAVGGGSSTSSSGSAAGGSGSSGVRFKGGVSPVVLPAGMPPSVSPPPEPRCPRPPSRPPSSLPPRHPRHPPAAGGGGEGRGGGGEGRDGEGRGRGGAAAAGMWASHGTWAAALGASVPCLDGPCLLPCSSKLLPAPAAPPPVPPHELVSSAASPRERASRCRDHRKPSRKTLCPQAAFRASSFGRRSSREALEAAADGRRRREAEAAAQEQPPLASAPGSLTRAAGRLHALAVASEEDVALARLQERITKAYLSLMARLERRYQERRGAPLPKGLSEEEKINALVPRRAGPLCGLAHSLRRWYNAARHERGQWSERPTDEEVARVMESARRELERCGL
uniref:Protein kinase domain-containing protein n=1 Tax=Emiliania huxleyi TaxID=2903 RepID=A0A7S3WQ21_EMIHU